MSQLLQNNKLVMSRDSRMTLIKHDVIYEYGGISRGGGTNMIGLIALSIAFGAVLNIIKEDGLPLVNLFRSLWTASMKLVEIIMWWVQKQKTIKYCNDRAVQRNLGPGQI